MENTRYPNFWFLFFINLKTSYRSPIYINTSALQGLLSDRSLVNNTNLPKLCAIMVHEMLHILCIGQHPNSNFGWASPKLNLVSKTDSGWLYTGKENSKALHIPFYIMYILLPKVATTHLLFSLGLLFIVSYTNH